MKIGFLIIVIALLSGCIGYFIREVHVLTSFPLRGASEMRQSGSTLVSPLLDCEVNQEQAARELVPFRDSLSDQIDNFIKQKQARHVSVYFRDLANGPWIGLNEEEVFSPGSLVKTPLMISVFQLAQKDPTILTREYEYTGDVDNSLLQHILPSQTLEKGKKYTLEELVRRMIVYSDNNASTLVSRSISQDAFYRPYRELGLPLPAVLPGDEYNLTVRQYATFFRVLYNGSYLSRDMSEKALHLLTQVEFKDGIVAGIPKKMTVAHKFGERVLEDLGNIQIHDCGIVYYPHHPYLLCIMTRGDDFVRLEHVMASISRFVYDEIEHQLRAKK